jgi:hypothetical protein
MLYALELCLTITDVVFGKSADETRLTMEDTFVVSSCVVLEWVLVCSMVLSTSFGLLAYSQTY